MVDQMLKRPISDFLSDDEEDEEETMDKVIANMKKKPKKKKKRKIEKAKGSKQRQCKIPGCQTGAARYGLCCVHGGSYICKYPDCKSNRAKNGFCNFHYNKIWRVPRYNQLCERAIINRTPELIDKVLDKFEMILDNIKAPEKVTKGGMKTTRVKKLSHSPSSDASLTTEYDSDDNDDENKTSTTSSTIVTGKGAYYQNLVQKFGHKQACIIVSSHMENKDEYDSEDSE